MLKIGAFLIKRIHGTENVWICKEDGEGMQTSMSRVIEILEKAIKKFWDENF